jgi:predicted AlkP superfamily phosphohydrolase/phosphomutase
LIKQICQNSKVIPLLILFAILPTTSCMAYIGPGAGIAVAGSFMVMLTAILSGILILLTWPARYIFRAIRFRRVYARSKIKKAVIIGFDGMDHALTRKWLEQGKLPHFAQLKEQGCFKPLASTVPPISPVAWSSFQTGANPGKHNIFDFLTRDRKTYGAKLSSTEIRGAAKHLSIGKYRIPLGAPDIRLLRKGVPFWKTLGAHGIFSSIIRVPISFPAEKFRGLQLSAMCVPDLRGTQGMFSHFTTRTGSATDIGGDSYRVVRTGDNITGQLIGPDDPLRKERRQLKCPFSIIIRDEDSAELKINKTVIRLIKGTYSDWIKVEFKASLGLKVSGICRFLLINSEPDFDLYVTPINIDPEKPVMPISYPKTFSTYLAKRQGSYATLGLAEDSWALNEKVIKDKDFLQQCYDDDQEREQMLFDSLAKIKRGLCVCVFDGTDRVQHSFWRELVKDHPANKDDYQPPENSAIEDVYKRADALLGRIMKQCQQKDTLLLVVSDHGFNSFTRGVDLNRWLEENNYLTLLKDGRGKQNLSGVDWSKTRAFAIGLSGIFLNIKGREAKGIVDPKAEAQQLRSEIADKLSQLNDTDKASSAVKQVYNALEVYQGPYKKDAPDLIVGYQANYRASWETAVGTVTQQVFHDNTKAWSGDHCIDQSLVPGVLFSNRNIDAELPRLMDIGPTVLDMFGVNIPGHMDGKPLVVDCEKLRSATLT